MKIEQIKLEISSSKLNTNLLLYKIIQDIIQAKLTNRQIIELIEQVKLLINSDENFESKKSILVESVSTLSKREIIQIQFIPLLENTILEENHFRVFKLGLNLIRFKDYLLEKSKLYADNFRTSESIHIMDFEYDQSLLNLPYSVRVSGALLIKALFSDIRTNSNNIYESIKNDIDKINEIDPETILQIIFSESAHQATKTTSGSNYEERFKKVLINNNIEFTGQSFDKNVQAVEYDFKLILINNKSIGVSTKRTLRERYKQNHEDVSTLEVDAMILVTLGTDLKPAKVNNILEKDNHYIFVASDLYNKRKYLTDNKRVFALNDLTNELLNELVESAD